MSTSAAVEAVIARIRPAILADGGDIELVGLAGGTARVRLTGACAGCPMAHMTLHLGLETALRRVDPGLRVEAVPVSGRHDGSDAVVLGPNPRMRAIFDYIERVGPGRGTVLVTGESGTGKEVVARAVHRCSPRRDARSSR